MHSFSPATPTHRGCTQLPLAGYRLHCILKIPRGIERQLDCLRFLRSSRQVDCVRQKSTAWWSLRTLKSFLSPNRFQCHIYRPVVTNRPVFIFTVFLSSNDTFLYPFSPVCSCNAGGCVGNINLCDKITGRCICKTNVQGDTCNTCKVRLMKDNLCKVIFTASLSLSLSLSLSFSLSLSLSLSACPPPPPSPVFTRSAVFFYNALHLAEGFKKNVSRDQNWLIQIELISRQSNLISQNIEIVQLRDQHCSW